MSSPVISKIRRICGAQKRTKALAAVAVGYYGKDLQGKLANDARHSCGTKWSVYQSHSQNCKGTTEMSQECRKNEADQKSIKQRRNFPNGAAKPWEQERHVILCKYEKWKPLNNILRDILYIEKNM